MAIIRYTREYIFKDNSPEIIRSLLDLPNDLTEHEKEIIIQSEYSNILTNIVSMKN